LYNKAGIFSLDAKIALEGDANCGIQLNLSLLAHHILVMVHLCLCLRLTSTVMAQS
jgi:hypothetical protein